MRAPTAVSPSSLTAVSAWNSTACHDDLGGRTLACSGLDDALELTGGGNRLSSGVQGQSQHTVPAGALAQASVDSRLAGYEEASDAERLAQNSANGEPERLGCLI